MKKSHVIKYSYMDDLMFNCKKLKYIVEIKQKIQEL